MERISLIVLAALALGVTAGCSGGDAQVSAEEEARYKNPQKPDFSKIPPDAFKPHTGPAFIGEPSKGSSGTSVTPPPVGK